MKWLLFEVAYNVLHWLAVRLDSTFLWQFANWVVSPLYQHDLDEYAQHCDEV